MDFVSSVTFLNEPLSSWTFLEHFCHHFWVGATAKQQQTHPKVMTKLFNWSEVHAPYEIGTLGNRCILCEVAFSTFLFSKNKIKIVRFHWIDPYVPKKQQDLRLAVLNKSWWVEIKRSFAAVQHLESIVFHYRKFNILQKRRYVHNWYCMDNCQLGLRLQYWHKSSRKTTERDWQSFANI